MANNNVEALDQYLTFTLDREIFALNISYVKEILDDKVITKIPKTPDYIRGVLNVRGHAVPVMDLRTKFGMPLTEMGINTCVIITELHEEGDTYVIGSLADSVQEVIEIKPDSIDPPPRMGATIDTQFIKGMGKRDNSFIIILDMQKIFSVDSFSGLEGLETSNSLEC